MVSATSTNQAPIRVLVVCTGNICRSPLAEAMLRNEAQKSGIAQDFVFESAGTFAEVGSLTHVQTLESAADKGLTFEPIEARQLTGSMLENADLILTAAADHRADVARTFVAANRKTFTIREFVRVCDFLASDLEHLEDVDRSNIAQISNVRDLLGLASKYRGFAPPKQADEDIQDPWGLGQNIYEQVADELADLSAQIVAHFEKYS